MAVSMVGGRFSTQNDSTMTREELRSPNPRLSRAAHRSSWEIYCLDTAFVLIDGTKKRVRSNSRKLTLGVVQTNRSEHSDLEILISQSKNYS